MLKPPLVDGKEELVWKIWSFLRLPRCVGFPAEPVDALDYDLDSSAGSPSRLGPILSSGIAMATSPGSSSVDFPSQTKLVGPLAEHPCGKDCKGNLHWPRHLGEVSFLYV